MAAHRYWRFLCQTNGGGGVFAIAEFTGNTAIGGTSVFTGGTASASTSFGGFPASNAFDGNPSTAWASTSATSGEWLKYDLGAGNDKDIIEFSIASRNDNSANQTPVTGKLQYSDDDIGWTDALTFAGVAAPALGQIQWTPIPNLAGKTYFDANNKTPTVSIVNSPNTRITTSGLGTVAVSRVMTGNHYFEAVATTLTGTIGVGFANRSYNMASASALGADNNGLSYRSDGTVKLNNATLVTIATYTTGDRIGVAVDLFNKLVWFRVNNGNWNNNAAYAPGGTGGIDFSTMSLTSLLAAVSASATGASWTGKFSTADFTDTPPSGYVSIDTNALIAAHNSDHYETGSMGSPTTTSIIARASYLQENYHIFTPSGTIKSVSGVVQESGVPVAGKTVHLYDQNTGDLLGSDISDGSGLFSIPALGRLSVFAVAIDSPTYQALIFDQVAPI